jgi:hypothetical protein
MYSKLDNAKVIQSKLGGSQKKLTTVENSNLTMRLQRWYLLSRIDVRF